MKIPFHKYHANSNDFILILSKDINKSNFNASLIASICDRSIGIGADGLFIISPSKKYDFFLDYYNSDGSWETFCANGSRCAAMFMLKLLKNNVNNIFETGATKHTYKLISNKLISMSMKIPCYKSKLLRIDNINGYFIDSGARHFVCEYKSLEDNNILNDAIKIRYSNQFKPKGINVNFYKIINRNYIEIRTYEKGIESIMTSCSSGSAAVVFHLAQHKLIDSPVTTKSKGGELTYDFNSEWDSFCCTGPAKHTFSGTFDISTYK